MHTNGPWWFREFHGSDEDIAAAARLIAAAPEMLDALKIASQALIGTASGKAIDTVIFKATGEHA